MAPIGCDIGTYNLITARKGEKENEIKYKKEINSFLEIDKESSFTFNMLKKAGIPLIEKEKVAYIVGDAAVEIARAHRKLELKRPMKDGCLNPDEKDAFRVLMIMLHSIIGEVEKDKEIVYFSVPANAVNQKTDADYHQKVLEEIFKKYNIKNKTINAFAINEGLALVFAELGHKAYTGIGVSCGAGQVNFCYSIFSKPVATFSIVNSGDWIDKQAAAATNENVNIINKAKHAIDLAKPPSNSVERAIQSQYKIMIEHTVANMKKAILELGNAAHSDDPVDIILGGGTSSPNHFPELFAECIKEANFPIPIGEVKRPADHLYAVARGCLVAAENA